MSNREASYYKRDRDAGEKRMSKKVLITVTTVATAALSSLIASTPVQAKGFGDFMNPGKWFGGNNDRDYYYDRGYGGYPGYGYGYPGYGYGYGAPGYGYGPYGYPGYGYGAPGYGYGYPGQGGSGGAQAAPPPAPQ